MDLLLESLHQGIFIQNVRLRNLYLSDLFKASLLIFSRIFAQSVRLRNLDFNDVRNEFLLKGFA